MVITRTTFHLHITRGQLLAAHARAWLSQRDPLLLFAAPLALLLIGLIVGAQFWRIARPSATNAQVAQSTQAPIWIIATARAVVLPTALPTAVPRMIVAYDQPNGAAFPDAIPVPAADHLIGRWGDDWIAVAWQPFAVWVRAEDLGVKLADVRPMPDIQTVPTVAPAPAPSYQVANAPAAPASDAQRYGLTDVDMDRALADHNAQQLAWCGNQQTAYCDLVRGN